MSIRLINLIPIAASTVLMASACDRRSETLQEPKFDADGAKQSYSMSSEHHDNREQHHRSDDKPTTILEDQKEASSGLAKLDKAGPRGEKYTTSSAIVAPKRDGGHVVVGDATVPVEWFDRASNHVRAQIMNWAFTLKKIDGKNLIGVSDENGDFVTWPGAKEFADGDYPEGYIFIGFDDEADGATKSNEIRF